MKQLSLLLTILMLLSAILMTACSNGETPQETTPQETAPAQTTAPIEDEPPVMHASISVAQLANYELIYAGGTSKEVVDLVKNLSTLIYDNFGVKLDYRTDKFYEGVDAYAKGQYEILIGNTNREESQIFLSSLRWDDYGFGIVGDKLLIAGKNEDGTLAALRAFVACIENTQKGEIFFSNVNQFLVQKNYAQPNLTINGISASKLVILCNQEELGGVAQIICDAIIDACGTAPPIVTDKDVESLENVFLIGDTTYIDVETAPDEIAYPTGKEYYVDSCMSQGIRLQAKNAAGYLSAANRIATQIATTNTENITLSHGQYTGEDAIGVMSFNLMAMGRFDAQRADNVIQIIRKYRPAVVGVQEADDKWISILSQKLGDLYTIVGEGRNADGSGEHSAILYLTDEFNCLESGTKWLSNTPDTPGSKLADSHYIRIMTYVHLERKSDGKQFLHVNTHLDYGTTFEEELTKREQMRILMAEIEKFSGIPTIITGDFNATADSPVYQKMISNGYTDACNLPVEQRPYTYHGLMGTTGEESHIDYIFAKDISVMQNSYRVCNERVENANVSDHYPIFAILAIKPNQK